MGNIIAEKTEEILVDSSSNFWDDLKERINAPFFVSFILSWCIINWKVILLLFWYSNTEIFLDKEVYRIEAISNELCWLNSFFWPLFATLIYIFIYPYFREYLRSYNAEIKTKGNQWINKVSKDESFQIRNYFKLKNLYTSEIQKLSEQRLDEATYLSEKEKFELERSGVREQIDRLNRLLELERKDAESLKKSTEFNNFEGKWDILRAKEGYKQLVSTPYSITISGNHIHAQFNHNTTEAAFTVPITYFSYDPFTKCLIIYGYQNHNMNEEDRLILLWNDKGEGKLGELIIDSKSFLFPNNEKVWFFKASENS